MIMRKYISAILLFVAYNSAVAQTKVDSLRLLQDVNGGAVAFTSIAASAATFGNGYGTNNSAFISLLRANTTALPITLYSITAVREANAVNLKWRTASESNSAYFEVLKSSDGKIFKAISVVPAAGNSKALVNYSFKDLAPVNGTNYYQLNMVDKDGKSKKSSVVYANFNIEKVDFNVFTDASKGTITLNIYSNKAKPASLEVYDVSGHKITSKVVTLENGGNSFEIKLNTSAKIIIVQLTSEGDKQVKKFYY